MDRDLRAHVDTASPRVVLSLRDQRILSRTAELLADAPDDLRIALAALHEVVASSIPNGRIYVLAREPLVIGSLISGVGITETAAGVSVVRVEAERRRTLGRLASWR